MHRLQSLRAWLQGQWPGLLVCATVALAARFMAEHYGSPVMLMALLLGMALNFLSSHGACAAGIDLCARQVLRVGVALLGLRISFEQVGALGWAPVAVVVCAVAFTMALGLLLARAMGYRMFFGLLTGGAVGICGASAALALSAAMPAHPLKDKATLFTVIWVSTLSTLAMVLYPLLIQNWGLTEAQSGFFIGATIHDVAQVVGAGYGISKSAGDMATLVKLMRVAMLLPVIVLVGWAARRHRAAQQQDTASAARPPLLPGFVIGFAVLMVLHSAQLVPAGLVLLGQEASQWCLVAAMAAIGMKTRLGEMLDVGWKPIALMVGETAGLALFVYAVLGWVL